MPFVSCNVNDLRHVPGIVSALRDALGAQAAAQAEAKHWRAQAEGWRQRYEQVQQVERRQQATLEPCDVARNADTDALRTVRPAPGCFSLVQGTVGGLMMHVHV